MINPFNAYLNRVNNALKKAIFAQNAPAILKDAMYYATSNGGKRLRPLLVYATAAVFNIPAEKVDAIAAAVECIHAYSLIHDDLPAMDDDNLRRGKPTCHIVFSEAIAILAGDALQTLAFTLITTEPHHSAEKKITMLNTLLHHAGCAGMVGGQALDMLGEHTALSPQEIEHMHALKTGALIRASILLGGQAANAPIEMLQKLDAFAMKLGLAFQLQDDLRDAISDAKTTGKQTQQDNKHGKSSYVSKQGVELTQTRIQTIMVDAKNILASVEGDTTLLQILTTMMIHTEQSSA